MEIEYIKKELSAENNYVFDDIRRKHIISGLDLSGLSKSKEFNGGSNTVKTFSSRYNISNLILNGIDIVKSNLSNVRISNVSFVDVCFDNVRFSDSFITASKFNNCTFKNVKFDNSIIHRRSGSDFGEFKNCVFDKVKFDRSIFELPLIENCSFENCSFDHTNFDGSRFKNVVFKSKVKGAFFRGYSILTSKSFYTFNSKKYRNEMINVDFSEAELIDVSFLKGIELSKCKFPINKEKYLLIRDIKKLYSRAKSIIEAEWLGEEKRAGLDLISIAYFNVNKQEQESDFIDIDLKEISNKELKYTLGNFFKLLVDIENGNR